MVRNLKEKIMEIVFLVAACASILAVVLICIFLFQSGLPAMKEIGLADFLLGTQWRPGNNLFRIFPMIVGSIYVTAGAILIGVPIGLFMAVYLAMYCPDKIYKVLKPAVDMLAGIPSIVYGFFGMAVVMIAGNQPRIPDSILKGVRTMTANIVLEMGYATDLHRESLIATGVVLFVFILFINLLFSALKRKGKY